MMQLKELTDYIHVYSLNHFLCQANRNHLCKKLNLKIKYNLTGDEAETDIREKRENGDKTEERSTKRINDAVRSI